MKGPEGATEQETWQESPAEVDDMPGPGGGAGHALDGSDDCEPHGSRVCQTVSGPCGTKPHGTRSELCLSTRNSQGASGCAAACLFRVVINGCPTLGHTRQSLRRSDSLSSFLLTVWQSV